MEKQFNQEVLRTASAKEKMNNSLKNINSTFGRFVTLEQLEDLIFFIEARIHAGKKINIVE